MAYLTQPVTLTHLFGATAAAMPKIPVPNLEQMLEVAVLDWFWTGDE